MPKLICSFFLIVASAFVVGTNAQTLQPIQQGRMSGLVVDFNRARVPGVSITIKSKRFEQKIVSSDDGSYEINLPIGKYKIMVEGDGFYQVKRTVRVYPDSNLIIDFVIKGKLIGEDK